MKLHIAPDEKVINRCIGNFEMAFPNENIFLILVPSDNTPLKYVNAKNAFAVKYNTKRFWKIIGDISKYDDIIIHSFNHDSVRFLKKVNHPKIYWIEWGADLYYSLLFPRGYPLFYEKDIDWRMSNFRLPYHLYRILKSFKQSRTYNNYLEAAKKICYFVPDSMYDEYPLLLQYFPELSNLTYKEFYYYPIDEVVPSGFVNDIKLGDNIIVGNSASLYGNHKLVFEILSRINVRDRKIIVPLSYGIKNVAKYVCEIGRLLLSDSFVPVTGFLPLQEYNELLASASVFIYGNWRQEAVGNILTALYIGGKVFLDEKNPLLDFYKNSGLVLFNLNELSEDSINQRLSVEEVYRNRHILEKMYSREKLISLIRENFN